MAYSVKPSKGGNKRYKHSPTQRIFHGAPSSVGYAPYRQPAACNDPAHRCKTLPTTIVMLLHFYVSTDRTTRIRLSFASCNFQAQITAASASHPARWRAPCIHTHLFDVQRRHKADGAAANPAPVSAIRMAVSLYLIFQLRFLQSLNDTRVSQFERWWLSRNEPNTSPTPVNMMSATRDRLPRQTGAPASKLVRRRQQWYPTGLSLLKP